MSEATIVVVPQLAGSAALVRPFTRELARRARVVVIEPPGFGASRSPHGVPSTRSLAEAALADWDARGVGRAHLFGVSLGGMIAQWMAIDGAERIDRLVLASTASRGVRVVARGELRALAIARCLIGTRSETAQCLVDEVLSDGALSGERSAEIADAAARNARSRADLAWLAAAAAAHDTERELDRIRAPALVLSGDGDRLVPPRTQAELAERIGARHVIVPACAHDLTLERPARTAALVCAFLGVRGAPSPLSTERD